MKRITKSQFAKYQLITVGAVLAVLKLLKAVNFNWAIALSPFILLVVIKLVFFVWGYIMYRKNNPKL